jgi:ATP-dependent DNA helicase RecG
MRQRTYNFIRKLVDEGRQVYIVCPMVEGSETADEDLKSAEEYAETLRGDVFPDLNIGLVHGRMKAKEKDAVMTSFAAGETDILVSTTVIEVGVDVPNAALMVVETPTGSVCPTAPASGRVGRGPHKSYCILFEGAGGETSRSG